jgi:NAD(P)-dependent dehydrogenase (short-subunit alcohol dehydrogenase family)
MSAGTPFRLDGKVALVTGCGSHPDGWGNGRAIATLLARQGAHVHGIDRSAEAAAVTLDTFHAEGLSGEVATCDVTRPEEVEAAVADCFARNGRIDILVNNVGQSEPGGPVELDDDIWQQQIELNLNSAARLCRQILPVMVAQGGGSIVNISSIAGLRYIGKPQVAYAAAKAALMQMSRSTAVLYADCGIRVNCVVPGLIDTPLVERLADKYAGGDLEGFRATRARQVPMGRMGNAWDVAHAALFFAADESSYITATELVVDGGLIAATR